MKEILLKIIRKVSFYFNKQKVEIPPHFSAYFKNAKLNETDYHKPVHGREAGNALIFKLLKTNTPFLVCRYGDAELSVVSNYLYNYITGEHIWNDYIKSITWGLNGINPTNDQTLVRFAKIYLDQTPLIDVLAVWNNRGEDFITRFICPHAELISLQTLEPFFVITEPWSRALEGKKVLVIHPYEESIQKQHSKHQLLFNNTFPPFDLITYKPFNTITHDQSVNFDWFDELEKMKIDITALSFDVALVTAGPFGFPLAAYIKGMGKQAIHIGGALQLFFGIKGRRWENREHQAFFNEHWIYPSDDETPVDYMKMKVDGGDYWK